MDKEEIIDNLQDIQDIACRLDLPGIYTNKDEYIALIRLIEKTQIAIDVFSER